MHSARVWRTVADQELRSSRNLTITAAGLAQTVADQELRSSRNFSIAAASRRCDSSRSGIAL